MDRKRLTSLAATLTLAACCVALLGLRVTDSPAAEPGRASLAASGASDGIPVGLDFDVPLIVAGKALQGKAHVNAERVLRVYYVADGKVAGPLLYDLIRRGDVGPGPEPEPKPKPEPQPTPKKVVELYVVWETGDAAQSDAAIRNASAWKTECDKAKIRYSLFDQDTVKNVAKYKPVVAAAQKLGLPAVVTVDEAGGVKAEPLPKTPAAMLELVRRVGR